MVCVCVCACVHVCVMRLCVLFPDHMYIMYVGYVHVDNTCRRYMHVHVDMQYM